MDGLMILVRSAPEEDRKVKEALKMVAAMLGLDELPVIAFLDKGVRCLLPNAFCDQTMKDYLQAAADLAKINVLSRSLEINNIRVGSLDPHLNAVVIDEGELAELILSCKMVVSF
jgi:sulfur relay (sulfurtransferase) DsrF/TusC family protein